MKMPLCLPRRWKWRQRILTCRWKCDYAIDQFWSQLSFGCGGRLTLEKAGWCQRRPLYAWLCPGADAFSIVILLFSPFFLFFFSSLSLSLSLSSFFPSTWHWIYPQAFSLRQAKHWSENSEGSFCYCSSQAESDFDLTWATELQFSTSGRLAAVLHASVSQFNQTSVLSFLPLVLMVYIWIAWLSVWAQRPYPRDWGRAKVWEDPHHYKHSFHCTLHARISPQTSRFWKGWLAGFVDVALTCHGLSFFSSVFI